MIPDKPWSTTNPASPDYRGDRRDDIAEEGAWLAAQLQHLHAALRRRLTGLAARLNFSEVESAIDWLIDDIAGAFDYAAAMARDAHEDAASDAEVEAEARADAMRDRQP